MSPLRPTVVRLLTAVSLGACIAQVSACDPQGPAPPPRVVSLTPLGTRAASALGLSDRIVAADAASRALLARDVPVARLDEALDHRPDLVLVGPVEPGDDADIEALRRHGPAVVAVDPHQLTEALALYEELGALLGDPSRGHHTANRIGDPFAAASARQLGRMRPRIAVVVDLDPPTLAGGHSFETDLVEIAGGDSITHGGDETRVAMPVDDVLRAKTDLVIVATRDPLSDRRRADVEAAFAPLPVRFTVLDPEALWLEDARDTIDAWSALVEAARSTRGRAAPPG